MQAQHGAIERLMRMPPASSSSSSSVTTEITSSAPRYSPTRAAFLAEASKRLAGSLDVEVIVHTMAEVCVPRLGDACIVCVLRDGHTIDMVAAKHRDPRRQPLLAALEVQPDAPNWRPVLSVAESQEVAVLSQVTTALLLGEGARDLGLRGAVLLPVIGTGRTLAVVVCLSERTRYYSRGQLAVAQELASRFALALVVAEQHRACQMGHIGSSDDRAETLATAIHDLMSPLSYIKTSAQMLRHLEQQADPAVGAELRRRLEGIDAATSRMTIELRRMLSTLRPPPVGASGAVTPTDLVAAVRRVVSEQQSMDAEHPIVILAEQPGLYGPWAVDELERLLGNLIGNAVKYSPAGSSIDVHVSCEDDADARWAVLQVRDRGFGIPAGDLPFVFEPFRRGSNVGAIAGSGLGLASVWQTVKQHDGRLWVESDEGLGTQVTVRLPLTRSATSTRS